MQTLTSIGEILRQIQYKDWEIRLRLKDGNPYLQVSFMAIDTLTGVTTRQMGRKWMLSLWMCRNEIVGTAFKAIEAAELHEMRENFQYRGHAIFGPHIDPEALIEVAERLNIRTDYRGEY